MNVQSWWYMCHVWHIRALLWLCSMHSIHSYTVHSYIHIYPYMYPQPYIAIYITESDMCGEANYNYIYTTCMCVATLLSARSRQISHSCILCLYSKQLYHLALYHLAASSPVQYVRIGLWHHIVCALCNLYIPDTTETATWIASWGILISFGYV